MCYILLYYVTLQNGKSNPGTSPRLRSWSWSRVLPFLVLFLVKCFGFLCRLQLVAVAVSALAVAVYSIIYTYVYVYVYDLFLLSDHVCSRLFTSGPVSLCPVMLSAVAVSVLAVSCPVPFPLPLQNVYSCCRCRYVLVPCHVTRSRLITTVHVCCRLFTAVCIRTFSVTKRSGPCPCPWLWLWSQLTVPVSGLVLVLVLVLV